MGAFLLDDRPERIRVRHPDDMRAMGHLMSGGVGIAIHGNHLHAQALQGKYHFLAKLACS